MHRWSSKLRPLAAHYLPPTSPRPDPFIFTLIHRRSLHIPSKLADFSSSIPLLNGPRLLNHPSFSSPSSFFPTSPSFMQVRHITAKQRKRKLKSRQPMTPITSKVKKIKMKAYSSYKGRFRTMNDGQIRRWKEGKRHNATSKSKKARRRLRRPGTVPLAYAKVMKKLNFSG